MKGISVLDAIVAMILLITTANAQTITSVGGISTFPRVISVFGDTSTTVRFRMTGTLTMTIQTDTSASCVASLPRLFASDIKDNDLVTFNPVAAEQGLVQGNTYLLCSLDGSSTGVSLYWGSALLSSVASDGSGASANERRIAALWDASAFTNVAALPLTLTSTRSLLTDNAALASAPLYLVDGSSACLAENSKLALTHTNLTISATQQVFADAQTSCPSCTEFQLCLDNAQVNVTYFMVNALRLGASQALASTTPARSILVESTSGAKLQVSVDAAAASGTWALFSSDGGSLLTATAETDGVANTTYTFGVVSSATTGQFKLSVRFGSSGEVTADTSALLSVFQLNSIKNRTAAALTVLQNTYYTPTTVSFDVVTSSVPAADALLLGVFNDAGCGTADSSRAATATVSSAATEFTVPAGWFTTAKADTLYVCFKQSTTNGVTEWTLLKGFTFHAVKVDGVVVSDGIDKTQLGDSIFLFADTSATIEVTGSLGAAEFDVGYWYNYACLSLFSTNETVRSTVVIPRTAFAKGSSKFCVIDSTGGWAGSFEAFTIVSEPTFTTSGFPAVLVNQEPQVITLSDTSSASAAAVLSRISFYLCDNADLANITFATPFTELTVTLSSQGVGNHRVCWRYRSGAGVAVFELLGVPTPAVDRNVFLVSEATTSTTVSLNFEQNFVETAYSDNAKASMALSILIGRDDCASTAASAPTTSFGSVLQLNNTNTIDLSVGVGGLSALYWVCGAYVNASQTVSTANHTIVLGVLGRLELTVGGKATATRFVVPAPQAIPNVLYTVEYGASLATIQSQSAAMLNDSTVIGFGLSFDACKTVSATVVEESLWVQGQTTSSTSVLNISTADIVADATLCIDLRLQWEPTRAWEATQIIVVPVNVSTADGREVDSAFASRPGGSATLAVLSGNERTISVTGTRLNFNINFTFFKSLTASCSDTPATDEEVVVLSTNSVNRGTLLIPQRDTTYETVCVGVLDPLSETWRTFFTNIVLSFIPLRSIGPAPSAGTQQTSVVAVSGIERQLPLQLASGTTSVNFTLYLDRSAACVFSTANVLPISTVSGSTTALFNGSQWSGEYEICAKFSSNAKEYESSLGIQLKMLVIEVSSQKLGSGSIIGATINAPIQLRLRGSSLDAAKVFVAINDIDACTSSAMSGTTTAGVARAFVLASGCGGTTADVTIPAATALVSNLTVCLAVAPTEADVTASSIDGFNAGLLLSIASATALTVITEPSTTTTSDGSLTTQPVLGLIDTSTGALLSALPQTYTVTAEWIAVSPIDFSVGERYTVIATAGNPLIDFQALGQPIRLVNGKHGIQYILRFSVLSSTSLEPTNSTVVRVGGCANTQYASLYTDECVQCPKDATCDGSTELRLDGYLWRPSKASLNFYSCELPFVDKSCRPNTTTGTCYEGHSGPRCSVCEPSYAKTFNACVSCGNFIVNLILVILAALISIVVVVVVVLSTLQCKKSDQFPIYVKVCINHVVVASMLEASQKIPDSAAQLFQVQRQISRPSPTFAAFDCVTGLNWYGKFIFINLAPLGIAIVLVILLIILRFRNKKQEEKDAEHLRAAQEASSNPLAVGSVGSGPKSIIGENSGANGSQDPGLSPNKQRESRVTFTEEQRRDSGNGKGEPQAFGDIPHFESAAYDSDTHSQANHLPSLKDEESMQTDLQSVGGGDRRKSEALGLLEVHSVIRNSSPFHIFAVSMIVIMFFTYPSIVEWCANVLKCDRMDYSAIQPDGSFSNDIREYFYFDRSRLCTDSQHRKYMIAGIVLGLFWGFGTPLWAVLTFMRYRRPKSQGGMGRVAASRMFTFLIAGYRKELWWWEAPMMIRKLMIIYVFAFVDPNLQNLLAFWIFAIHLVFHNRLEPYEYQTVDNMERVSLGSLCVTLQLISLFDWVDIDDTSTDRQVYAYMLVAVIVLLNTGVLLWMLVIIGKEGLTSFRKFVRDNKQWIETEFPACIANIVLRLEYPPQEVVEVNEAGELVPVRREDVPESDRVLLDESSGSDWSDEDEDDEEEFTIEDGKAAETASQGSQGSAFAVQHIMRSGVFRSLGNLGSTVGAHPRQKVQRRQTNANKPRKSVAFIQAEVEDGDDDTAAMVSGLAALVDGIDEHAHGLTQKYAETAAKLEKAEKALELCQKQLSCTNEYAEKLNAELQKYMEDLDKTRRALALLEEENEKLRATGGAKIPADLEESIQKIITERNDLVRQMAEMDQAVGRPSTADSMADVAEQEPMPRTASMALFGNIKSYRSHIESLSRNKDAVLATLQREADQQVDLVLQMKEEERVAQEEAIRRHLEMKRNERRDRRKSRVPASRMHSVVTSGGAATPRSPAVTGGKPAVNPPAVHSPMLSPNQSQHLGIETDDRTNQRSPSPSVGGKWSTLLDQFVGTDIDESQMFDIPDGEFDNFDEFGEERVLIVKRRHPKKRAEGFIAPWGHSTWKPRLGNTLRKRK